MSNQHSAPTLLVMAGGTGGHIFPGLAVADKLKSEGWHIHWLGTADRMEADIIPKHGYDISFINISGLRHKNLLAWLKLPFKLVNSLLQAFSVIKTIKPDVVLGMGGYASAPGGLAAWLMRKPLIVHEQNAAAGLTNRLLARIANKVCCAFPNAFKNDISAEVVGNPLRASIGNHVDHQVEHSISEDIAKISNNILVVGGSLGAQVLNQIVPMSFAQLVGNDSNAAEQLPYNIRHQTGKGKQNEVIEAYNQQDLNNGKIRVTEFIDDIASAYKWADVVICRAGALTVSELAMAATPAIFVPLPHAVDDHQVKNAQYLVSRGGAILVKQQDLTSDGLTKLLNELFSEPHILKNMAQSALAAADINATDKVAHICQQFVCSNKS
ncbi:undecaprenyldiphospho-muramoylpentapeptide beta-N-acetylglucosaminyltransferase [Candidatus Colwellia aromaticivorans]|uniref:undecaprenyldiphospho-muramoylpentapeptide beta-N-acetylglucosaminyltransferase n=1 Tax=Candidatus Colwellia aromaticivorans TaxID=2267621 RepID=UPI000DF11307|nr:undecaprenyldiphospho-muramoylpentapeptide beta-N-acetylglucosaminyltransferase [Candidatus Colwellia aromaticivorans]